MGDLGRTVGANQRAIRALRGMSLDALAKASGVSRSNLAQIESGRANPSIGTVWQIASALRVGFSELVSSTSEHPEFVDIATVEPTTSEDGSYRAFPVFAFDPALGFELYVCELDPNGSLAADPHPGGTHETIVVIEGWLVVRAGDAEHVLGPDQALRFRADQPHAYASADGTAVRFSMILAYAKQS